MKEEAMDGQNRRRRFQLEDGSKLEVEPTNHGVVLVHLEGCGTWEFTPEEATDLRFLIQARLDQVNASIEQHELLAEMLRSAM